VSEVNWKQVTNMLGMTNLLLLAVVVLLAWNMFRNPEPVGRFQHTDTQWMALDTKTGQLCWTGSMAASSITEGSEQSPRLVEIPLCSELK
jgi:hypothetical protein